jgi:hypothetical protein
MSGQWAEECTGNAAHHSPIRDEEIDDLLKVPSTQRTLV